MKDWDETWRATLADPRKRASDRCRLPLSPFLNLVDWFERRSWRRVLVVGCGISTEPAAIAHVGYEVVAFDVSRVAIDHITSEPATLVEIASWLSVRREGGSDQNAFRDREDVLANLEAFRRPGGSLRYECAPFTSFEPRAPFDIVYCPWSWQCLDSAGRLELPRCVSNWLTPGGACRVAIQNVNAQLGDELERAFLVAGFFRRDAVSRQYFAETYNRGLGSRERYEQHLIEDDLRAHVQLDEGGRMFDAYHASG
jgi:SAM-dependent methyltransferase